MKRISKIYDACSIAIRVAFFGFILIGFGFIIKNESVNIFYTFKNTFLLFFAEGSLKLGTAIISNLPMIFIINIVCKKANSGFPIILGIVGYFAYLVATCLFAPSTLNSNAYLTAFNITSTFNLSSGTRYPLETGLIGSFIVAYITRFSFIRSRHRTSYSLLGFLNKDSAGVIYNIVFCTLAGIAMAFAWPYVFGYIQNLITFIGKNYSDPIRMGIYGIADRFLSILSLGKIIRQPFWYTALGGSYQTVAGQTILGDVNIWQYVKDSVSTYSGAGRFITPYYVINMFMIPAIYIGIVTSISNKQERSKYIMPCLGGCILSVICGNPLPLEFVLLFTSPLLLFIYLVIVGIVFYACSYFNIFLGSTVMSGSVVSAMPGNFPDFIINLRNINYLSTLYKIALVGLVAGLICFAITLIYYRFLAYDTLNTGKAKEFANTIIEACGGKENVVNASSGLFEVCIYLNDLEKSDIEKIKALNVSKLSETKEGYNISIGASAYIIAKKINRLISK